MRATVRKMFDFPAAHANAHHDGHCQRLHGHTWILEVFARGPIVNDPDRTDFGMVVDFERLKHVYHAVVEPYVEHQNLNESLPWVQEHTTELIAGWILKEMHEREASIFKVRLHEGLTSYAEVDLTDIYDRGVPW